MNRHFLNIKLICIILCIFIKSVDLNAQADLKDNNLFCKQYSKIIESINNDSIAKNEFPFKRFVFKIDNEVSYGIGIPFMTKFYVAETLGLTLNDLNRKDSITEKLWTETEKAEYVYSNLSVLSTCLAKLQNQDKGFNIVLSFARKNEKVVFVNASRIYNYARHTSGVFYLFFFDDQNDIKKIYRSTWIE